MSELNAHLRGRDSAVADAVTFERLVRARTEPHNWLTYDGQRFSALDQTNTANAASLPTGEAIALDARTGEQLWSYQTGSGIHSNPITYSVNGKQYLAVPSGWAAG
ncbi:MAG: hypothetical protein ACRELD_05335 [Longimicrobiales bacterium]